MGSLAACRNGATLVRMRSAILVVLLVAGCVQEAPDSEFVATTTPSASTTIPMDDESSSSGDEPPPEPYGPCAEDEDCVVVEGSNGVTPEFAECRDGACTYACGDGFAGGEDVCPDYVAGYGGACINHRCRAIDCSSSEQVNGRCCADWCGGECYGPPGQEAICECDGPALGCPCETWCGGTCREPGTVWETCECQVDAECGAGQKCRFPDPDAHRGNCA